MGITSYLLESWRTRNPQVQGGVVEPLLVLGDGRSGTTLLMQLLGTSRRIAFDRVYPYENRYLTYLYRWAAVLGEKPHSDSNWNFLQAFDPSARIIGPLPFHDAPLWNGAEIWTKCLNAAWREFSQSALVRSNDFDDRESVLYYAEKSPFWLPKALRKAMHFRVIVLIRDPRDMFLSIMAFNAKRGFFGFGQFPADDAWGFAQRFIESYKVNFQIVREEMAERSSILVRYEEIVLNIDNEAARIGKELGLKLDPSEVVKRTAKFSHHMTSVSARASVARWRSELSSELASYFREQLGNELHFLGYEA